MVGTQDIHEVDENMMKWLREEGRDLTYKTIEKIKEETEYFIDFSLTVILPTDRDIYIEHEGGGGVSYPFRDDVKTLRKELERLRKENPKLTIKEITGKEMWRLEDNQIFIDMTWHGGKEPIDKILTAIGELWNTQPKAL